VADCGEGRICTFNPLGGSTACTETCAWVDREPCSEGTCVFDFGVGDGDTCITDAQRLDAAIIGGDCAPSGLQKLCNIAGFALGFCDYIPRALLPRTEA
jgi:hypothetical protein